METLLHQTDWQITSFLYPSPGDGVTWKDTDPSHWIAPDCNDQAKWRHATPGTTCTTPQATFSSAVTSHNIQYSDRYHCPWWFTGSLAASWCRTFETTQKYYDTTWHFMFSLQHCSVMWCCALGRVVANISTDCSGFIFNDQVGFLDCLTLRMNAPRSFETSGTTHTKTQPRISEDLNLIIKCLPS
jgi:hypothetical protein